MKNEHRRKCAGLCSAWTEPKFLAQVTALQILVNNNQLSWFAPAELRTPNSEPQTAASGYSKLLTEPSACPKLSIGHFEDLCRDRPRIIVIKAVNKRRKGLNVGCEPGKEQNRFAIW